MRAIGTFPFSRNRSPDFSQIGINIPAIIPGGIRFYKSPHPSWACNPMKTLKATLIVFFVLCRLMLSAQSNESITEIPYSNKIEVREQLLEDLFQSAGNISLSLTPAFKLEGKIQNKSDYGNSTTSLLIRLAGNPSGMLSITRFKDKNGRTSYAGQLMKLHDPKALKLIEKDHHYYFIEIEQKFLVSE